MLSHQDIKTTHLEYLPAEILLAIASLLRPEDAVCFFKTSRAFIELNNIASFWKAKLALHFPHTYKKILNKKSDNNWREIFNKEYKGKYFFISSDKTKLFSILKGGRKTTLVKRHLIVYQAKIDKITLNTLLLGGFINTTRIS